MLTGQDIVNKMRKASRFENCGKSDIPSHHKSEPAISRHNRRVLELNNKELFDIASSGRIFEMLCTTEDYLQSCTEKIDAIEKLLKPICGDDENLISHLTGTVRSLISSVDQSIKYSNLDNIHDCVTFFWTLVVLIKDFETVENGLSRYIDL